MNSDTIVTHCLAVWHEYAGMMHQSDKDFFDAHINHMSLSRPLVATQELITARLHAEGHSMDEAIQLASGLVGKYAQRWGVSSIHMVLNS